MRAGIIPVHIVIDHPSVPRQPSFGQPEMSGSTGCGRPGMRSSCRSIASMHSQASDASVAECCARNASTAFSTASALLRPAISARRSVLEITAGSTIFRAMATSEAGAIPGRCSRGRYGDHLRSGTCPNFCVRGLSSLTHHWVSNCSPGLLVAATHIGRQRSFLGSIDTPVPPSRMVAAPAKPPTPHTTAL